jgi:protein-S-isoprenylcysteine O-methyltransferase Ste14
MAVETIPAYGLWNLVIINTGVVLFFAVSFYKPKTKRDWRSFGAFGAFILAMFTEMYGFPLTIYLLSGWLQSRLPGTDILSHDSGHLWHTLLGFEGNPHLNPIHIASNVLIVLGFVVIYRAWKVLYVAQRNSTLASTGPYAYVRHPQYDGFILIMLGFLLMWPTILSLLMFPVLFFTYYRLAKSEENEVRAELGHSYTDYAARTPAFIPRIAELLGPVIKEDLHGGKRIQ